METFRSSRAYILLALICAASFVFMFSAAKTDSAIMDELAHIPAGYAYVHALDYRLNPEHPPLVKAIAELPLLFLQPEFPTQSSAWTTDINGQWTMGNEFLYHSGNNADQILLVSRIGPMILTILAIILVYILSAELLGSMWALLPAFLFGLSPTIIAHGHYVTTDVGAAFGVLLSVSLFLKFLLAPARSRLFFAGLGLGIAELLKFSTVLLLPFFAGILFLYFMLQITRDWNRTDPTLRAKRFGKKAFHFLRSYVAILFIGYTLIVYPVYFLFTLHYPIQRQVADTEFTLGSFAGGPPHPGELCKGTRCLADLDIWMAKHEATRPLAEYTLGVLMVMQRSSGGNTNYFLGQVSAAGSRLYFPLVFLLKESFPSLILICIALLLTITSAIKGIKKWTFGSIRDYLELHFAECSMLLFVVMYWTYSMQSPLNIGYRHLLPTLAFIYILTAISWKHWIQESYVQKTFSPLKLFFSQLKNIWMRWVKYIILFVLLVWLGAETAYAAPFFLSYFNEFGGGIMGGYRYVTDSNYDWGQDLTRLKNFVNTHPEIDKLAIDYFGGGDTGYYLGSRAMNWQSSKGDPKNAGIHWLAVSINSLEGAIQPLAPGQTRNPEDEYAWLTALRPAPNGIGNVPPPDFRIGTSIFVYHLY